MSFGEHSKRAVVCGDSAVRQLRLDNSFDDVVFDTEFLLPLSLVGLSHIAHETIYHDAVRYLISPALVEMLAREEVRKWESMQIETVLGKILGLRRGGQAHNMIPTEPTEHMFENALLRYLRYARDVQLRKCVREHRRLREIDEEVAQLNHKVGPTSNEVAQTVGDGDEDNITFIDDECMSSRSQFGDERNSQKAGEHARASSL